MVDHIIDPVTGGGSPWDEGNLRAACRNCNNWRVQGKDSPERPVDAVAAGGAGTRRVPACVGGGRVELYRPAVPLEPDVASAGEVGGDLRQG